MFYNIGDLASVDETNSILNQEDAEKYVAHVADYPLPYDIALPLFSWVSVFRNNEFSRIISDVSSADLASFYKEEDFYRCKEPENLNGWSIYPEEKLRFETVSKQDITQVLSSIKQYSTQEFNVIYYQINSKVRQEFSASNLQNMSN